MISDSTAAAATPRITLPKWMNVRRQRCMAQLLRFAWGRPRGRLCLTSESTPRACADAGLLPHELDRAIDDLAALDAVEVRYDGLTDFITFRATERDFAWRPSPPAT